MKRLVPILLALTAGAQAAIETCKVTWYALYMANC